MALIELNFDELLSEDIDSISGRRTGQKYVQDKRVLDQIDKNTYKIIISPKVKAINDSFIKGFFSEIFKKYKTKEKIKEKFIIEAHSKPSSKCWMIYLTVRRMKYCQVT